MEKVSQALRFMKGSQEITKNQMTYISHAHQPSINEI